MKKSVFFATVLVAGILTVGIAQYPAANNKSSETIVSAMPGAFAIDTVPEKPGKDTTVPGDTDSSAIRF